MVNKRMGMRIEIRDFRLAGVAVAARRPPTILAIGRENAGPAGGYRNHLGTPEHPLPLIPGMVATVEVLTGHKTVLDYLTKPARLLREEALRER
jgi:hypothetical protein